MRYDQLQSPTLTCSVCSRQTPVNPRSLARGLCADCDALVKPRTTTPREETSDSRTYVDPTETFTVTPVEGGIRVLVLNPLSYQQATALAGAVVNALIELTVALVPGNTAYPPERGG